MLKYINIMIESNDNNNNMHSIVNEKINYLKLQIPIQFAHKCIQLNYKYSSIIKTKLFDNILNLFTNECEFNHNISFNNISLSIVYTYQSKIF